MRVLLFLKNETIIEQYYLGSKHLICVNFAISLLTDESQPITRPEASIASVSFKQKDGTRFTQ